jgi:hypothetical protein
MQECEGKFSVVKDAGLFIAVKAGSKMDSQTVAGLARMPSIHIRLTA